MITRDKALTIVQENIKNPNLVKHCLAVEAVMRSLAKHFNQDEEVWGLVGLLHDADWELTRNSPELHTKKTIELLKTYGENDPEITQAILAHNSENTGAEPPQSQLDSALYCCDELTGLVVAVALVTPTKKLQDVTVDSVLKKFKAKSFAAGANREQISLCQEKLGIELKDFVTICLEAMKENSSSLNL
jgi:putative nucleotidyltransferase with HDIG domain